MPGQDDIYNQQSLLGDHRRTLGHALRQAAAYGGLAFAPPATANGIHNARAAIRRIKETLRGWGVPAPDHPDDEALPAPAAFPPNHATVAAGQDRLAALPTADDEPIPEPAAFFLAARMQLQPNPLFVGRDAELRTIARLLKPSGGAVAVTTGIGGVGKTQLAAEFAHRYGQFFAGGVFWISFADPAAIPSAVAAYGGAGALDLFHPDEQLPLEQHIDRVRAQWAGALPRLLIFDNCDDWRGADGRTISGEALLREWRPPSGGCRVLITSRRAGWSPSLGVSARDLHALRRNDSVALLQSLAPTLSTGDAAMIAAELGDLPLALFLAGNYLRKYSMADPPTRYLERLRTPDILAHPSMQGRGTSDIPTERAPHVARAFALSYERLDLSAPADALAAQLLARAACLAPGEPFPQALLAATAPQTSDDDALLAIDAIERLLDLGLLEAEAEDTLRIHRLIGAYAHSTAPTDGAQAAIEAALTNEGNRLVNDGIPARLLGIVTHLRHALDTADPRGDARAASLLNAAARAEQALTNYVAARPLYERALAIREQALGPLHPDTAFSLNNLAELLRTQGDYAAARPYYERALVIREQALGSDHPSIAAILNGLALLLKTQGDYAAARPLYERALTINELKPGPNHPNTAASLNNLAALLRDQGDYAAARPLFERALSIWEHALGQQHPNTAASLNNLAGLLQDQGDHAAARPLYERALTIREQALGPLHPHTAASLNNLAGLLRSQDDQATARPLFERALAIYEQALGPMHPHTATALNNLAELLRSQGDYAAARSLYERALAIREQALGPQHPATANSLNNLAELLRTQGDYVVARPLFERALAIHEQALGPQHPDTATSLNNLALLLHDQGDYATARPLFERALSIREQTLGSLHPNTAASLNNLAELLRDQDDYAAAHPLFERALAVCEQTLGPQHPYTIGTRRNLENMRASTQHASGTPVEDTNHEGHEAHESREGRMTKDERRRSLLTSKRTKRTKGQETER